MKVFSLEYPTDLDNTHLKEIVHLANENATCRIGTVYLKSGKRLPEQGLKAHPFHEISIIMEGKVRFFTETEERILEKGDIINLNMNEMQAGEVLEDCKIVWVLFA